MLNVEVPALLVTLRTIADQFPGDATTMVALNQLALGYEDLDRYQAAAEVLEHLGAQFPGNPMEVWFRLGEAVRTAAAQPREGAGGLRQGPGRIAPLQGGAAAPEAEVDCTAGLLPSAFCLLPSAFYLVLISTLPVTTSMEITGSPLPSVASLQRGPHVSRVVIGMSD